MEAIIMFYIGLIIAGVIVRWVVLPLRRWKKQENLPPSVRLHQLNEQLNQGKITEEQYQCIRAKILNKL